MQPMQRALPPNGTPGSAASIAAYLAALIDGQASSPSLATSDVGRGTGLAGPSGLTAPWNANALVWIESEAGSVAVRDRGMISVAHGPGHASDARTYVISYPDVGDGKRQRLSAITAALAGRGWQLLRRRLWRTATGSCDTAVLVNMARPGWEERLWLAEPAGNRAVLRAAITSVVEPGSR